MAILDITGFMTQPIKDKTRYQPLPKFPGSTFDCTVMAGTQVAVADILAVTRKLKMKELVDLRVVYVYLLSKEEKTVTLRAWFLDREKTLGHDYLRNAEDQLVAVFGNNGFALKQ